jgi:hypothetical protein
MFDTCVVYIYVSADLDTTIYLQVEPKLEASMEELQQIFGRCVW